MPRAVLDLAAATLDGEILSIAPARGAASAPVRSKQFHAYIFPREIVRGVVRDLPHELEALRVGDEFSAEIGSNPFGSVLDMQTFLGLRHSRSPVVEGSHSGRHIPLDSFQPA